MVQAQRYQSLIKPWAIYRTGLNKSVCVARYKSRNDADGHLALLRRNGGEYTIMYELPVI